jgi:hypothetical protein
MVLHSIWGHRLIRHVTTHDALDTSQYAIPGQTCNSAVLNKVILNPILLNVQNWL